MVHSPEEQLLSLSPAPSSRRSSSHVTQEALANLYDDGSDRQESQAGPSSIVTTHAINAMYTPFMECPYVTHDLYIPLPTMIRGYITLPENKCTHLPYPLRKRQPESKRLERTFHPMFDQESHITQKDSCLFRRSTKRHSLASGQIERLVNARRGASNQVHQPKSQQHKSDSAALWPLVKTSPPPPPPPPPPNNGASRITFDTTNNRHMSPAASPPRHPFEK